MKKLVVFLLLVLFIVPLYPQDKKDESGGKFSGYMFGDYYYLINDHDTDIKDMHGLWFRRIYFTYDYTINKSFSTRLRLEMSNEFNFKEARTVVPFVKDAWLKYKFGNQALILGINPTPTWDLIEHFWGYRSVEKTPLDLQNMGSSRDFGLALKGRFDQKGIFNYHFMVGNGSSNKQEIDKGKSAMFALAVNPVKFFVIQVYGDYADHEGDTDWYTLQGFVGYKTKVFRVGLQYVYQTRQKQDTDDLKMRVLSFFAVGAISDQVSLLGRIDRNFDPNPKGEAIPFIPFAEAKNTFFVGGIDWHPIKSVSFIPNIEYISYDEVNGESIANDAIARITFFWKFK
ncbi:hypothetical protein MNBD_IGNAVI01-7 [hydrothermal vent metagenome]|uniref:Porin n=1 Tax=hydrothermal vent metagenome TaxID=652676 RepID=A0A3B1D529_9ZZZZ